MTRHRVDERSIGERIHEANGTEPCPHELELRVASREQLDLSIKVGRMWEAMGVNNFDDAMKWIEKKK